MSMSVLELYASNVLPSCIGGRFKATVSMRLRATAFHRAVSTSSASNFECENATLSTNQPSNGHARAHALQASFLLRAHVHNIFLVHVSVGEPLLTSFSLEPYAPKRRRFVAPGGVPQIEGPRFNVRCQRRVVLAIRPPHFEDMVGLIVKDGKLSLERGVLVTEAAQVAQRLHHRPLHLDRRAKEGVSIGINQQGRGPVFSKVFSKVES